MTEVDGFRKTLKVTSIDAFFQFAMHSFDRLNFPQAAAGAQAANPNDYEQYGYDNNNNRTSLKLRSGETITYDFDALNRTQVKHLPDTSISVYYGYDLQGHNLHARFGSGTGLGVTNAFDGFGRLTSTTSSSPSDSLQLQFQYDADGDRTQAIRAGDGSSPRRRAILISWSPVQVAPIGEP